MLLKSIAEIADEPLMLEPADPTAESQTNTWWLSANPGERASLSVEQLAAAFHRTAEALRSRVHGRGFQGTATFYVWYDEQAGQLRCSTSTRTPETLPFNGTYAATEAIGPILEQFLSDGEPGLIRWATLDTETDDSAAADESVPPAFTVWTRSIGHTGSTR